jgi:UDPglucose 6-dehydrogenase
MEIAMIGTRYVGHRHAELALRKVATMFTCVDVDRRKIERLKQGRVPIYEPGLTEMVLRNSEAGRLRVLDGCG